MKMLKGKKGFTLIELVIVIAILGILAGLAIPRFLDATATARGSRIVADLRTIDSAVVIYNAKSGKLPSAKEDLLSDVAATGDTQAKYKLLATWPTAPQGAYIIMRDDGTENTGTNSAAYTLNTTAGRGELNGTNASGFLAAVSSSSKG